MHASMRAANVFQGASQGIKTMDGHPKNIVCPSQGIKTMDGQPKNIVGPTRWWLGLVEAP